MSDESPENIINMATSCPILPLPSEVRAQIRSSLAITSLNDVFLELLKNALDAGSTTINAEIDFSKGFCAITDDGTGIPLEEFTDNGHLGLMHCTSKVDGPSRVYGQYGRFLAYLSSLSLLSITSCQDRNQYSGKVVFHHAKVISRSVSEQDNPDQFRRGHGTKVVVRDIFGNMPVRLKHRAEHFRSENEIEKEYRSLKRRVVGLLLACSKPLDVSIVELNKKLKYISRNPTGKALPDGKYQTPSFDLNMICGTLLRAAYISPLEMGSWRSSSARTTTLSIRAAISLDPAASKETQFMSIGIKPLDQFQNSMLLFDEVNHLFEMSRFGSTEDEPERQADEQLRRANDRCSRKDQEYLRQPRGIRKGIDRWPMFYIRMDTTFPADSGSVNNTILEDMETERYFLQVLDLLRSLIHHFLVVHQFRPRARQKRQQKSSDGNWEPSKTRKTSLAKSTLPTRALGQSFDTWSRVKGGDIVDIPRKMQKPEAGLLEAAAIDRQSQAAKVDLGKGTIQAPDFRAVGDTDVQLLLDNLSDGLLSDDSELEEIYPLRSETGLTRELNLYGLSSKRWPIDAEAGDAVFWTNLENRSTVQVHSRIGNVVPQVQDRPAIEVRKNDSGALIYPRMLANQELNNLGLSRKLKNVNLRDLLTNRTNLPLSFRRREEPIPSVNCPQNNPTRHQTIAQQLHGNDRWHRNVSTYFAESQSVAEHRLCKDGIRDATVLGQVDQKFILVRMPLKQRRTAHSTEASPLDPNGLLVLIDQHAADERIKVEQLSIELCKGNSATLAEPILFEVSISELSLFEQQRDYFKRWKIWYEVRPGSLREDAPLGSRIGLDRPKSRPSDALKHIAVLALPILIAERCRLDPRVLIDLMRREVWSEKVDIDQTIHDFEMSSNGDQLGWVSSMSNCPKGLLEMINSRACRSAAMFNDELSITDCVELVRRLAVCVFPFQCAHGRPSMVLLTELNADGCRFDCGGDFHNHQRFLDAWKSWQSHTPQI